MANARIIDANLSDELAAAYKPLLAAKGISGRAQTRVARITREAIRQALTDAITLAYADGAAPYRTGRGKARLYQGVRAFGSNLASLRGYIVGPEYLKAHEDGSTITPKNAKKLAIPLQPALRGDGTPKLPGPRSWRNVQRTFIYKSRRTGQSYIAYKNLNDSLTLLYVLVDSATLSKYKGFLSSAFDVTKFQVLEALGQAMLFEMSRVDLGSLARVTTSGRRRR